MWGGSVVLWCRALKVAPCQARVGRASTSERRGRVGRGAVQPWYGTRPAVRSGVTSSVVSGGKTRAVGNTKVPATKKPTGDYELTKKTPPISEGITKKTPSSRKNPFLLLGRNPSLEYGENRVFFEENRVFL